MPEDASVELVRILNEEQASVLAEASESLHRAHLVHYEEGGPAEFERRLADLFALVVECIDRRTLGPICAYAEHVAGERFLAGFQISEVQTAFNVLEEAIWQIALPRVPVENMSESAGLIGTVLGAGKEALALKWVSLATSTHVRSLDLTALFDGAAS